MDTSREPGGRASAPPPLDIVQAFLNSIDLEDGPDLFAIVDGVAAWIDGNLGLTAIKLSEADRARVVTVRELLRDVLTAHSGDAVGGNASKRLEQALDGVSLSIGFDGTSEPKLIEQGNNLDAVLAILMRIVYTASIDGTWQRLKVCRNDTCRWAFYDASKNRSGVWCTMAICGNKTKARAYRRRSRKTSASS